MKPLMAFSLLLYTFIILIHVNMYQHVKDLPPFCAFLVHEAAGVYHTGLMKSLIQLACSVQNKLRNISPFEFIVAAFS